MSKNFYVICDKAAEGAIEVKSCLFVPLSHPKEYIRKLTSEEMGKVFMAAGKWYAEEGWKNFPIDQFVQKECKISRLYLKCNMDQSRIAEVILQRSWLIEVEYNEDMFKSVFIPFSFNDIMKVTEVKLSHILLFSIKDR